MNGGSELSQGRRACILQPLASLVKCGPYRCLNSLHFGLHMDQRNAGAGTQGLKPEARPCEAALEHTGWKPLWKWLLWQQQQPEVGRKDGGKGP